MINDFFWAEISENIDPIEDTTLFHILESILSRSTKNDKLNRIKY